MPSLSLSIIASACIRNAYMFVTPVLCLPTKAHDEIIKKHLKLQMFSLSCIRKSQILNSYTEKLPKLVGHIFNVHKLYIIKCHPIYRRPVKNLFLAQAHNYTKLAVSRYAQIIHTKSVKVKLSNTNAQPMVKYEQINDYLPLFLKNCKA